MFQNCKSIEIISTVNNFGYTLCIRSELSWTAQPINFYKKCYSILSSSLAWFSPHICKSSNSMPTVLGIISSKNSLLRLCYIQQHLNSISNDFHARNIMTITSDQNKYLKNCSTQPFGLFFSFFPLCDYFFEIMITALLPSIYTSKPAHMLSPAFFRSMASDMCVSVHTHK